MATLAVIGGGWAGLAAAVEGVQRGLVVTLYETAAQLGGRARSVSVGARELDNGQHILIGAYTETLRMMRLVGADPDGALLRTPLRLVDADGHGLALPSGHPAIAFVRGVLAQRAWPWRERYALLLAAAGWARNGFVCAPTLDVAALTAALPARVRDELIDPLCVAALNTPAASASGAVFLRVLKDALFSGPGSADLLLPRAGLSALFPQPAAAWLTQAGAAVRCGQRVQRIAPAAGGWEIDGTRYDRVVLAAPAGEAARLAQPIAPDWSARATALQHEPIVSVYLRGTGVRLPAPMLALPSGHDMPAQFVFDRGQLGGEAGLLAFVISGAQVWTSRGRDITLNATKRQAEAALGRFVPGRLETVSVLTEKRATFACTPALERPPQAVAPGLSAAGDYIEGPYPATLEGAIRSGLAAIGSVR
ncbi:MAG: FAD-dependent oxidoreductase [Proteobacteria bacterium]|nr:FAD-dependent oxidoreductase [Pseudomonadota bacterium]